MILSERFKTNHLDEIPDGGVRLYDIADKNGNKIESNVKLIRSNGNKQEGDVFSSTELNAINKFLNGLISGDEKVNDAIRAEKLIGYKGMSGIKFDWKGHNEGLVAMVDVTENCPMANSVKIGGYKIAIKSVVTNPAGTNYIDVPIPDDAGYLAYADAINGNGAVSNFNVLSRRLVNGNVRFTLSANMSYNVQLDTIMFYKMK